ncbi:hypothetical protein CDAR_97301 [Caerostris darwini]|uniref:Uncharacterized protein n=1 Tax=Caerostris darwini TaxID=1538125 RepID=A0AAV4R1K9_9ARAC|nr:hypothetical protein CDAR_97301 [Caerostris darwini]
MEEICQRDKIIMAKIDLVKGMQLLERASHSIYQLSLCSIEVLEESFAGNTVFEEVFAIFVSHIENVEYLLLFVHARMTDISYKSENEEAMIYPSTRNELLKIREDFVHHRDCIFFWAKIVKAKILSDN